MATQMKRTPDQNVKHNVERFDEDVRKQGGYAYTGERLSSRLANDRISRAIAESYNFKDANVLDLGCGDGAYTVEFASLGVRKVLGIDPAAAAIEVAAERARELGIADRVTFAVGNIYELEQYLSNSQFDCIVIRGVLHHLPDPERAILGLQEFRGTLIVLEPNGYNPVLKVLERYSRYHIEHEERSFTPRLISHWIKSAGFTIDKQSIVNLVPFFCPDQAAKTLRIIEPLIEKLPLMRHICCGQCVIVASK